MSDTFAQRLIWARSGYGWSQADLAEVSGVAAAQISRYEAGRAKPRSEVVAKLAKSLAVSFEWLREGAGRPEAKLEVPVYPASQKHWMSTDVDSQTLGLMESIAEKKGITVQMLFKEILEDFARGVDPSTKRPLIDLLDEEDKP